MHLKLRFSMNISYIDYIQVTPMRHRLCPSYPCIEIKIVRVSRIRPMLHMSKKPDDYRNIFRKSINGYPNYAVNLVVVIIMLIAKPNDKFTNFF